MVWPRKAFGVAIGIEKRLFWPSNQRIQHKRSTPIPTTDADSGMICMLTFA